MRNTYRVKSGESPADIAQKYTGDRNRYIDLIPLNPQIGELVSSRGRPVFNQKEWRDHMIINIPSNWTGMRSSSTIRSRYNCSHTVKGPIPVKSYLYVVQKDDFGNSQFSRSNITPKIANKFNVSGDRWFEMLNANYNWKGGFVFEDNICMPSGLKAGDLLKIPASWPPPNPGVAVRTASGFTTTNNSGLAGGQQVSLHTSPQHASQQVSLHTSPQHASQQVSLHTSPQHASSQVALDQRQSYARDSGLASPRVTGLGSVNADDIVAKLAEVTEQIAQAEQNITSGGSTGTSNKGKDCSHNVTPITEIKNYFYKVVAGDIDSFWLIPSKFGMGTDKIFWQQLRDANHDWAPGIKYNSHGSCVLSNLQKGDLLKVPRDWKEPIPGRATTVPFDSKEVEEKCGPDQIYSGGKCVDRNSPESPITQTGGGSGSGGGSGLETVSRTDDGDDSTIWILLAVGAAVAGGIYMYNARKGK